MTPVSSMQLAPAGVLDRLADLDEPARQRVLALERRMAAPDQQHAVLASRSRRVLSDPPTTGRVVNQYLSGTQTRRIGGLVDAYSEPRVEIHPRLAEELGLVKDDWVTVTTRRAEITLQVMIVRTIRPDTVFIPYHWPGSKSANLLTHRTLDPTLQDPRVQVLGLPHPTRGGAAAVGHGERRRRPPGRRREGRLMFGYEFYVDPSRCIGCGACEAACAECETHRGVPLISVDFLDRNRGTETVPTVCMHCKRSTNRWYRHQPQG